MHQVVGHTRLLIACKHYQGICTKIVRNYRSMWWYRKPDLYYIP